MNRVKGHDGPLVALGVERPGRELAYGSRTNQAAVASPPPGGDPMGTVALPTGDCPPSERREEEVLSAIVRTTED